MFKVSVFVLTAAVASSVSGADLERGKVLLEMHCRMCHESVAFERNKRVAQTYAEVKAQVIRWQANTSLHWSDEDIENVTSYVARTYYKIPCPKDC